MRAALVFFVLGILGCVPSDLSGGPPTEGECADAGDGGVCALDGDFGDAGPEADPAANFRDDACPLLVARVCGAQEGGCQDAPACVAAQVLDEADAVDRCVAAYDDTARWPDCVPGPCAVLVERVCGGQTSPARCEDAPGCAPARDLLESADSDDAEERQSAETSCSAALEDDVVFSTCAQ